MKLIALMPVRNEEWILGFSARVALEWCDALVLLDHASTDSTPDIIRSMENRYGTERVLSMRCPDEKWDEMAHRELMLTVARNHGATHIAIVDADEALTADLLPDIRVTIEALSKQAILAVPMFWLRDGLAKFHSNGVWGNRTVSIAFADDPRLHWCGDRFHHREPMGAQMHLRIPLEVGRRGVLHFWGADERRLRAKHALYAITERLRWPNKPVATINALYGLHARPQFGEQWRFTAARSEWLAGYSDWVQHIHLGAPVWQEHEVERLISLHGREAFSGLDLYGVA